MIRYALTCAEGHHFESWFQSAAAFDSLSEKGMVACAVCGSTDVKKALMTPKVAAESKSAPAPVAEPERPLGGVPANPTEQMLRALKEHVDKTSTYVGGNFAKEARAMHLGETPEKPIHGEANAEEAKALIEDGVPVMPLPVLPKDRAN